MIVNFKNKLKFFPGFINCLKTIWGMVLKELKMRMAIRSLRVIIALSFIAIMIVVYSVTYYAISNKFEDINKKNMESISIQVANQLEYTIKNYVDEIIEVSDYIIFQLFMNEKIEGDTAQDILKTVISSREDIESIVLFNEDGSIAASSGELQIKRDADVLGQQWFRLPQKDKNEIFFSEPHVQNLFYDEYPWVISLSRNVGIYSREQVNSGVLLIEINIAELGKMMKSVNVGSRGYEYLIDKYGNIIYHPDQQLINYGLKEEDIDFALKNSDGSYIRQWGEEEIFTIVQTSLYTGWKIVIVNYVDDIMVPKNEITTFLIATVLIGLLIIVVISSLISSLVSRPVLELERSMKSVEQGDFDLSVDVRGDSEVERLSAAFNKMVSKIKALMGEIVHEQEEKRKNELKALQMQIQPHFLYNTLESIIWMAENKKNEEVVKMISALAKLFRISLNKGMDSITVREELMHAQNYLIIQKMRYGDKFDYMIEANEEAKDCITLKIILQPIVENAIYHGIKQLYEKGFIRIEAKTTEDKLIFIIEDNGVGINSEKLRDIFNNDFAASSGSGVGVKNVHERIKLYYGKQFGLHIQSEEDKGTVVMIVLPKIMRSEVQP